MNSPGVSLSIVVPVYRSEPILPLLVEKVQQEISQLGLPHGFELILVNDASPVQSW